MNKKMKKQKDTRVNVKRVSWQEYLAIWFIMLCLTGGQAMIFYSFTNVSNVQVPFEFIMANMGYWALMTLCICFVTAFMRRKTLIRPMEMLGEAAKKVANGDFTVRLGRLRKDGKKDNIEVMFEDFNTMAEELSTIETLKTDFIANVSHEIKTPLAIIQSYAMGLQKSDITAERRNEYADTIVTASQKLSDLVSNILKLSKLENSEIKPRMELYDLCGQLAECALAYEDLWEAKNIEFTADMDDRAMITADRGILEIVWNNLLLNAVKFTEPGGTVSLTQTSEADSITVTVSDSGCGMNEETKKHIFDKFYQGDTSHSQEGNGLGLALAVKAVELMGGSISVTSEYGQGSTFKVLLKI